MSNEARKIKCSVCGALPESVGFAHFTYCRVPVEAERDALLDRLQKAEQDKHLAERAAHHEAQNGDEWRERALKAESAAPERPTPTIRDALRTGSRKDYPSDELCDVRYAALLQVLVIAPVPQAAPVEVERDARYDELIMAVGMKWSGETRHETALRYIRQAERPSGDAAKAAMKGEGK